MKKHKRRVKFFGDARIKRANNRIITTYMIKLRDTFGAMMLHQMETSQKFAEVLGDMLKDCPVDKSNNEYVWNIMGHSK